MDSAEVRFCPTPGCGRKLRRHNTKGICGYCQTGARRHLKRTDESPIEEAPVEETPAEAKEADRIAKSIETFCIVARALGFAPDEILEQLVTEWMRSVGESVRAETGQ
jgi:hypothetical protein